MHYQRLAYIKYATQNLRLPQRLPSVYHCVWPACVTAIRHHVWDIKDAFRCPSLTTKPTQTEADKVGEKSSSSSETQRYSFQATTNSHRRHYKTTATKWTRGLFIAEEPRDALYRLKSCQLLYSWTKKRILRACFRCKTLKVTQGIGLASIRPYITFKVICSHVHCKNNISDTVQDRDVVTADH